MTGEDGEQEDITALCMAGKGPCDGDCCLAVGGFSEHYPNPECGCLMHPTPKNQVNKTATGPAGAATRF